MDLVVDYIRALDVVIIPGSHVSHHGDGFIEEDVRDSLRRSGHCSDFVEMVGTVSMSMGRH